MTFKIVAVNSSPRMDNVNTALILTPFLEDKREMGADPESFSMRADPVDDVVVFMIITQYYGREEFEIDGQKRSAHKFGSIDLIEGRRPEG